MGCNCTGYPFFHRKGSLFCWFRADGTDRYPGDPDFCDRYADSYYAEEDDDIPFDVAPNSVDYHDCGEDVVPF